jgi:hypothetical protein
MIDPSSLAIVEEIGMIDSSPEFLEELDRRGRECLTVVEEPSRWADVADLGRASHIDLWTLLYDIPDDFDREALARMPWRMPRFTAMANALQEASAAAYLRGDYRAAEDRARTLIGFGINLTEFGITGIGLSTGAYAIREGRLLLSTITTAQGRVPGGMLTDSIWDSFSGYADRLSEAFGRATAAALREVAGDRLDTWKAVTASWIRGDFLTTGRRWDLLQSYVDLAPCMNARDILLGSNSSVETILAWARQSFATSLSDSMMIERIAGRLDLEFDLGALESYGWDSSLIPPLPYSPFVQSLLGSLDAVTRRSRIRHCIGVAFFYEPLMSPIL